MTARNGDGGPMGRARAQALLQLLRGPAYDGVMPLDSLALRVCRGYGLDRGWLHNAGNHLVDEGLATIRAERGTPTLRLTEKGRSR